MQADRQVLNAALYARRQSAVARGVGQAHEIFIKNARNSEFWDVEGRRFIDSQDRVFFEVTLAAADCRR